MRRRIKKSLRVAREVAGLSRLLAPLLSFDYLRTFRRGLRVCREGQFEPTVAFRLGLFDPTKPRDEHRRHVGRRRLTRVQEELNPVAWTPMVKNKDLFYRYCAAMGVPTPRLYAVVHGSGAVWSPVFGAADGPDHWRRMLSDATFDEFVAKPAVGAHGTGFNVFVRSGDEFTDAHGKTYSPDGLRLALIAQSDGGAIILQQRLRNHPELVRLTGSEVLQTVRMLTLLGEDGACRLIYAYLKTALRGRLVDNFGTGIAGNIQSPVRLEDGVLGPTTRVLESGEGIVALRRHPETGERFEGVRLPFWTEAHKLACETARLFSPLRSIGWDVALTPDGPVIVEGNSYWDPPNLQGLMVQILETLRRAAEYRQR